MKVLKDGKIVELEEKEEALFNVEIPEEEIEQTKQNIADDFSKKENWELLEESGKAEEGE